MDLEDRKKRIEKKKKRWYAFQLENIPSSCPLICAIFFVHMLVPEGSFFVYRLQRREEEGKKRKAQPQSQEKS